MIEYLKEVYGNPPTYIYENGDLSLSLSFSHHFYQFVLKYILNFILILVQDSN